jgi:citrate lyase subunit beta/citryl-CoA lyase
MAPDNDLALIEEVCMALQQPLRSMLFVPGNKPHMLDKARTSTADAVILDLEDGVPPTEKEAARAAVRQALEQGGFGPQVVLRINAFPTGLGEEDLRAAFGPAVNAICMPKAEAVSEVLRLAPLLTELEQEHGLEVASVDILLMIESARGLLHAYEMASVCWRVRALCLGGEDLARDLGATRTREGQELLYARSQLVYSARAAGIAAIDTIWTDLDDPQGLEAEAHRVRQLGYSGKLIIHPGQVEPVHRGFAPTEEEVTYAQRVIQAFEAASLRGNGVIVLDGQMIDAPVVARAREILALAGVTAPDS